MMKASVYYGKNDLRIEDRPIPTITAGECLIKVDFCGICGTDIKKIHYGLAKAPVVLGHEITGTVIESKNEKIQAGDRVAVAHHVPCGTCHYCRHGSVSMCAQFKSSNLDPGGYSQFCRVPEMHVAQSMFKLAAVSQEDGIFMEPLACAVRNLDMHDLQAGDLAVIVGLGSMGLLSAQALHARGVRTIGLDLKPERLALARSLGVTLALDARANDAIHSATFEKSAGRGCDILIVTAGPSTLLASYLPLIRSGGALNIFSSLFPETPAAIPVNDLYHREIHVTSSYSASPEALREAHHLLETGQVRVRDLISKIYPLEALMQGVAEVADQTAMKILIAPSIK